MENTMFELYAVVILGFAEWQQIAINGLRYEFTWSRNFNIVVSNRAAAATGA